MFNLSSEGLSTEAAADLCAVTFSLLSKLWQLLLLALMEGGLKRPMVVFIDTHVSSTCGTFVTF